MAGPLLVAVSAVCFAGTAILARLAYADGMDPTTFLGVRFAVAGAVVVAPAALRRTALPRGRSLVGLVLMGAVGYAAQATAYFTALTLATRPPSRRSSRSRRSCSRRRC
jgi:drug/metabolite transporter (DMT)-like permease